VSSTGHKRTGLGMALLTYGFGHKPDTANVSITIGPSGQVEVMMGTSDLGGGQATTLSMIVAEELGAALDDITVLLGDTNYPAAPALGSFGSRTTFIAGNAAKAAAANAKQNLLTAAAGLLGTTPDQLATNDSQVMVNGSSRSASFSQVAEGAPGGAGVQGSGQYTQTAQTSKSGFQFGACFAEVQVNLWTGKIDVKKLTMVQDYGQVINPLAAEGQMQGAAIQGLGYGLLEDYVVDVTTAQSITRDWLYYKVPTTMDVPEMVPIYIENPDPRGPFGAKGAGESMIICTHSAIRNAIANAIGVRFTSIPITPQMVLEALKTGGGQ
jgi:CO/xanthine dehydrogenase Mo-binding subunit